MITTLKKASIPIAVNPADQVTSTVSKPLAVRMGRVCVEAEGDAPWSYVGNKSNQRWLWYAIDHASNPVLADTLGKRQDEVFKTLKGLLAPLSIHRYSTDNWWAYERHLARKKQEVGQRHTQKIERKHLNGRTGMKCLAWKTPCFSKSAIMHDRVIGLLMHRVAFGLDIHAM